MKKINVLIIAMLAVTVGFITSCKDDDPVPPTITVSQTSIGDILPGSKITYEIVVGTSNGDLKTLTVKGTGSIQPTDSSKIVSTSPANAWNFEKNEFIKGNANVTVTYEVVIGNDITAETTFDIEFKVADEKGEFNSATKTITVKKVGDKFGTDIAGSINHAYGAGKGGYDLVAETQISLGGSVDNEDCDMFNLSTQAADFDASWKTGTSRSTKYVKLSGVDYENALVQDVISAIDTGTATVSNPAEGDIYGVLLSDGITYAIMKIEVISKTGNATKTGEGYMKFTYKKGTVPTK